MSVRGKEKSDTEGGEGAAFKEEGWFLKFSLLAVVALSLRGMCMCASVCVCVILASKKGGRRGRERESILAMYCRVE